jgi:hypothetical protein
MKVKVTILLALAVITLANAGCCRTCRNWLQRGSLCGTKTAAPAVMGAPMALGTPYAQPQYVQPQMAAPMQQMVMPQANCQCVPQCIPMCQPCYDPCSNMCSPCGPSMWSGGYMGSGCCEETTTPATGYDSGATMVPSTQQPSLPQTFMPQGSSIMNDPGPARGN